MTIRRQHLVARGSRRRVVARMDIGEHIAYRDDIAPLCVADDADRVVDLVVLRHPPGAEMHGGVPDGHGAEPLDDAVARRRHLPHDGRAGERALGWIAALGSDPAIPRRARRPVGHRLFGAPPALRLVDAEVGEREQVRR